MLETNIDITEGTDLINHHEIQGEIEFCDVYFSYSKNGEYVLKNISFTAKAGDTIGIIGSTGSGKSTLVKLIPRLYDPDVGEILIDGINAKDLSLEPLRSAIGFVPQKAMLFSGTIEENFRFGKEDATEEEMDIAAQSAAASEFVDRLEGKYEYRLMQGATNLSGGQKQRLSMARAFIRKPKILVLDDSTSAIDALSEFSVQQALARDFSEGTVFIIASKISSIIDADQILVMKDGMIEASGPHKKLLMESDVYRDIYHSQIGEEVKSV